MRPRRRRRGRVVSDGSLGRRSIGPSGTDAGVPVSLSNVCPSRSQPRSPLDPPRRVPLEERECSPSTRRAVCPSRKGNEGKEEEVEKSGRRVDRKEVRGASERRKGSEGKRLDVGALRRVICGFLFGCSKDALVPENLRESSPLHPLGQFPATSKTSDQLHQYWRT